VVYALLVDRVESRGLAQFQASVVLLAAGSKTELVDPDRQRVVFDAWLNEPLKPLDPADMERLELLQALGLR
jgi:hypothetical protein